MCCCYLCTFLCKLIRMGCRCVIFVTCIIPLFLIIGLIFGVAATTSKDIESGLFKLTNQTALGNISVDVTNAITEQIWGIRYVDVIRVQNSEYALDIENPFTHKSNATLVSVTHFLGKILSQLTSSSTKPEVKRLILLYLVPENFVVAFTTAGSLAVFIYLVIGFFCFCGCFGSIFYSCCRRCKERKYIRVVDNTPTGNNNINKDIQLEERGVGIKNHK